MHGAGGKSLFFANVAYESTEASLRHRFANFGPIKTIYLLRTQEGHFKGKGIVQYGTVAAADRAYEGLHHAVFNGRRMVIDEFRPEKLDY